MSQRKKVAIVTGANQGLGFALVETLCKELGDNADVYLTARNNSRGEKAVNQLKQKGFTPLFYPLDVTDEESIKRFSQLIEKKHGGVDIVISNAAARISPEIEQSRQVASFINTNNHGSTYLMMKYFAPLLKDNSRFLVIASAFGSLTQLPQNLHKKFDVENSSLEDIERVMGEYMEALITGKAKDDNWPEWINIPSKTAQVASIKILANKMKEVAKEKNIMISAVCPGLVDTDASRPWFDDMSIAKSPLEAAVDVVWLATLENWDEQFYGELVQYRKIIAWNSQ